jgi:hypothetical protein
MQRLNADAPSARIGAIVHRLAAAHSQPVRDPGAAAQIGRSAQRPRRWRRKTFMPILKE